MLAAILSLPIAPQSHLLWCACTLVSFSADVGADVVVDVDGYLCVFTGEFFKVPAAANFILLKRFFERVCVV